MRIANFIIFFSALLFLNGCSNVSVNDEGGIGGTGHERNCEDDLKNCEAK